MSNAWKYRSIRRQDALNTSSLEDWQCEIPNRDFLCVCVCARVCVCNDNCCNAEIMIFPFISFILFCSSCFRNRNPDFFFFSEKGIDATFAKRLCFALFYFISPDCKEEKYSSPKKLTTSTPDDHAQETQSRKWIYHVL